MTTLLLLNGPSGVGKSTLARLWAAGREAICWDPDDVRLGLPDPTSHRAKLDARATVLAAVRRHLSNQQDVVVPQLCARPDFPVALEAAATAAGAAYHEVLLLDSASRLDQRNRRRAASNEPRHQLAHRELTAASASSQREALMARAANDRRIAVLTCSEGQQPLVLRALDQITGPPRRRPAREL